jgi:hypothetical protein
MHSATLVSQSVRTTSWTGRILSGVVIAFMVFDGVLHLLKPAPVVEAFAQLGYPVSLSVGIGILELICTALYAIPRTAALGALLLTAYLGGAIATQVRVEAGWFPTTFPVLIAALLWSGLALRDSRVWSFFSLGE